MAAISVNANHYGTYSQLASGKRINTAADDAAGLAIGKKMEREETGLSVGAQNAADGKNLLNVADGALDGMMNSLQRIRELGLKSMNGLYSDSDRQDMQREIDGLKEEIQSLAKNTTFNEHTLLDGSMADMNLATNPDGGGMKINMLNSTLDALGIANFDVTSANFNLDDIDKAIQKVSDQRGYLGASVNRLEHTYNYNTGASLEQLNARSRIEDLDMPQAISKKKKEDLLNQYQNLMLKRQMDNKSNILGLFQ